ncbi:MAG: hypothetical protein LBI90_10520 [Treponema sp.]|jgi:hypothetical protein|nr:hypothetical protein [Treponema sp.]
MNNKLSTLMELVKRLPEKCLDAAIESLEKMKEEMERQEEDKTPECPHCRGKNIVKTDTGKGSSSIFAANAGRALCGPRGLSHGREKANLEWGSAACWIMGCLG